jgi:hypothetical protein
VITRCGLSSSALLWAASDSAVIHRQQYVPEIAIGGCTQRILLQGAAEELDGVVQAPLVESQHACPA